MRIDCVHLALAFAPLCACLGGCEPGSTSSLVIVVDSNYAVPQELESVRVLAHDDATDEQLLRRDLSLERPRDLPLSVELVGEPGRAVRVRVEARDRDGKRRSVRQALTKIVSGHRLLLPMFLARHCSWTGACGEDETCAEDAPCASALIAPEALAEVTSDEVLDLPFDPAACGLPCAEPTCGNGRPDPGEVCDDGNRESGDGCRADCAGLELCGDGIVDKELDEPEECDDGNVVTEACDYGERECLVCNSRCKLQQGDASYCGDGITRDGERCDDGNHVSGDHCRADCGSELRCGDGVVDSGPPLFEVCDDGNARDCDGCNADCRTRTGCGDGVLCDDELCEPALEPDCRADCMGPRECGDGFLDPDLDEQCDDGDQVQAPCPYGAMSCTVCSADCRQVPGLAAYCGDGVVDAYYETCDWAAAEPCRPDCTRCGDGVLDASEPCDDGGKLTADCSPRCTEVLFFDDMEGEDPGWTQQSLSGTIDVPSFSWVSGQRASSGRSARYSGSQPGSNSVGNTRLLSPVIDVAGLERVLVIFSHYYDFDRCPAGSVEDLDGGFVEVALDGAFVPVAPVGSGDVLGSCGPLAGQSVYSGRLPGDELEQVVLPVDVTGVSELQVAFHVRWDCQGALGCGTEPEPRGWYIDDVAVARAEL